MTPTGGMGSVFLSVRLPFRWTSMGWWNLIKFSKDICKVLHLGRKDLWQ